MRTRLIFVLTVLLGVGMSYISNASDTFILHDLQANKAVVSEGNPDEFLSPCSTFKVALSLMGFESGYFKDPQTPKWEYLEAVHGKSAVIDAHKQDLTPATWMKFSAVWYSQELTKKLGAEEFQKYIKKLDYGNQDLTGDEGKNNGLTHCWLGSSLKITPTQQLAFVSKLAGQKVEGFSAHSQKMTRDIMNLGPIGKGCVLFGKTGSGYHKNADGSRNEKLMHGWFVGWIEKDEKPIYVFVYHKKNVTKKQGYGGPVAKESFLKRVESDFKI